MCAAVIRHRASARRRALTVNALLVISLLWIVWVVALGCKNREKGGGLGLHLLGPSVDSPPKMPPRRTLFSIIFSMPF